MSQSPQMKMFRISLTLYVFLGLAAIASAQTANFEAGLGDWEAVSGDWIRRSASTPSSSTGPSSAYQGGYYLYMETSSGYSYSSGDVSTFESPAFNAANANVSFRYHMYGSNMGSLYVDIYNNGSWKQVWSRSGQAHASTGAAWSAASVSLSSYKGPSKIRFRGVAAGGWQGDMAIDAVSISTSNGTVATPSAPSLPSVPSFDLDIDRLTEVPGEFSVNLSGQATYSIPIQVARGSGGFGPSVSLEYSSGNKSDGLLGIGWSLNAAGSISRCRQTWGQDRNAKPISWSSDDRFCLNGQRLLLQSGNYGADGSTYKTEIDSYARITALGGNATTATPTTFKVEYKNGVTGYFGQYSDARVELENTGGSGTQVLTWKISRKLDSAGNAIEYSYDPNYDDHPLTDIHYAFDKDEAPHAHIQFGYEDKDYDKDIYLAGYKYTKNRLLKKIRADADGLELSTHIIKYNEGHVAAEADYQDRITSVQRCVETASVCSKPTSFNWWLHPGIELSAETNDLTFRFTPASQSFGTQKIEIFAVGDINGDGISDLAYESAGWIFYKIGREEGNTIVYEERDFTGGEAVYVAEYTYNPTASLSFTDYNGDGREDLVVFQGAVSSSATTLMGDPMPDAGTRIYLAEPLDNGTWGLSGSPIEHIEKSFSFNAPIVADVNGDGLRDLIGERTHRVKMLKGHGAGYADAVSLNISGLASGWADAQLSDLRPIMGDFNGDGLIDFTGLTRITPANGGEAYYQNVAYLTEYQSDGSINLHFYDYINSNVYPASLPSVECELGGDRWTVRPWKSCYRHYLDSYAVVDLNSDGLSDVVVDNGFRFSLGNQLDSVTLSAGSVGHSGAMFFDVNGDGHPDRIYGDSIRYWDAKAKKFESGTYPISAVKRYCVTAGSVRDINADGMLDVLCIRGDANPDSFVQLNVARDFAAVNKIKRVDRGNGKYYYVDYNNIHESEHYDDIIGVNTATSNGTVWSNTVNWRVKNYASSTSNFYDGLYRPFGGYMPVYSTEEYPVFPVLKGIAIVEYVEENFPVPGSSELEENRSTEYFYEQARIQASGRGFLGFKTVNAVDSVKKIRTETTLRQDWPFIGKVSAQNSFTYSGHKLNSSSYNFGIRCAQDSPCIGSLKEDVTNDGSSVIGSLQIVLTYTNVHKRSLRENGAEEGYSILYKNSRFRYDDKGNLTWQEAATYEADDVEYEDYLLKETIDNTFNYFNSSDTYSMQMGRLSGSLKTSDNRLYDSIVTENNYTYYRSGSGVGLLETETIEPSSIDLQSTTTHSYDGYGNRTQSIAEEAATGDKRYTERSVYDSAGRFVDETWRYIRSGTGWADTKVSAVEARDKFGAPTRVASYNGGGVVRAVSGTSHFGRVYFQGDSSGRYSKTTSVAATHSYCSDVTKLYTYHSASDGTYRGVCYDFLGRIAREFNYNMNGRWVFVDTEYDLAGRVERKSEPYFRGNTPFWTTTVYDLQDRPTSIRYPHLDPDTGTSAVTTFDYIEWRVDETNARDNQHSVYKNALGQVRATKDQKGNYTYFKYDAHGNLKSMIDSGDNQTTINYDLLGRKTAMNDPDKGNWQYQYNAFGELTCQQDAKNQHVVNRYDRFGRMLNRRDYAVGGTCDSPTGALKGNTTWNYDQATYGVGQLQNMVDTVSGYQKHVTYDALGRPSVLRTRLRGENNVLGDHHQKTTYNAVGQVFQVFDAARNGADFTHNGFEHYYTRGVLTKINDAERINNVSLETYYQAHTQNERGNITQVTYGNGVEQSAYYNPRSGLVEDLWATGNFISSIQDLTLTWDEVGNLDTRHEQGLGDSETTPRNLKEEYRYDALNRLTDYERIRDYSEWDSVSYDATGNITYRATSTMSLADSDDSSMRYTYGAECGVSNSYAGPHAVCGIYGDFADSQFRYDRNGNQVSSTGDGARTISYSVFDKPVSIQTSAGHSTNFAYDPMRSRYKRTDTKSGETTTTLYIGSVEKVSHADGRKEWKRTIGDGLGVIIQEISAASTIVSESQNYYLKDHLGSINLVTDSFGDVIAEMDYDPWGLRRNSQTWKELLDSSRIGAVGIFTQPVTTRGYTGHEMLDDTRLIHMNGRIYDPKIARFVQADPIIQDPYQSQSLNRYSYVWNNPLNATDPSGFCKGAATEKEDECDGAGKGHQWDYGKMAQQWAEDLDSSGYFQNNGAYLDGATIAVSENYAVSSAGISPAAFSNFEKTFSYAGTMGVDSNGLEWVKTAGTVGISRRSVASGVEPWVARSYGGGDAQEGRWSTMLGLTWDWVSGTGASSTSFVNDAIALSLQDADVVNQARGYWYGKVRSGEKSINDGLTNFKGETRFGGGNFGFKGFYRAGLDPVEQFIGSFRVDITSNGNALTYTINNTSSFKSFFYGVAPAYERQSFLTPMGNIRQTYQFTETIDSSRF